MPRKKAAAPVKPSETMQVPSEQQFASLAKAVKNADADIHDAQGTKSAIIKKAVKNSHLHAKAFAAYQKLARMSDKALADFQAHIEHYCEVGGLNERLARQGELVSRKPQLTEADVETVKVNGPRKKRKDSKVVQFKQGEKTVEFDPADGEAVH